MGFFDWFMELRKKEMVRTVVPTSLPRVPKWCHPGKKGKSIVCPNCYVVHHVVHFSWNILVCPHCSLANQKYDWFLLDRPSKYLLRKNK